MAFPTNIENIQFKTTDQNGLVEVIWTPTIRFWFVVQLGTKVVMEFVFIYLYYILQKQQSKKVNLTSTHF